MTSPARTQHTGVGPPARPSLPAPPAPPARREDDQHWSPRLWAMLIVLCGALFLDALDVSMVGV
ncbi:MAG TPA: hypothetical protein VH637_15295, partial [Streptosporangiaceae bacterium]